MYVTDATQVIIDINGYFAPAGYWRTVAVHGSALPGAGHAQDDGRVQRNAGAAGECGGQSLRSGEHGAGICVERDGGAAGVAGLSDAVAGRQAQPLVSTLNAIDGFITNNMAIVPTVNGSIDAFANGTTQLILDLFGYFAP